MSRITWSLSGMELDQDHFRVTTGTSWFPAVKPRRNVITVAGRSGSVPTDALPVFDEREITIQVFAWGKDWEEKTAAFHRVCAMPTLTLRKRTLNGETSVMETRVELTSLAANDNVRPALNRVQETAVFSMTDVWWRSDNYLQRTIGATGGTLLPKPQRYIKSGDDPGYRTMRLGEPNASTSILFDQSTIAMFGDAPIPDAVIRIPSTASVSVTDPISGTGLSWLGAKPSATYIYLDSATLKAWTSNSIDTWTPSTTDASAGLDYPSAGPLILWPDVDGAYDLTVSPAQSGQIAVRFKRSWW